MAGVPVVPALLAGEGPTIADDMLTAPEGLYQYPEAMLEGMEPAYADGEVHPYLASREVSFETAHFLDLQYDQWRDRIVFPVRGFDGKLYGLHGRSLTMLEGGWTAEYPKYWAYPFKIGKENKTNSQVWLGESWVDFDKPVLVVESVFDLARCLPLYGNTITARMTMLNKRHLERIASAEVIYTLFDDDQAGSMARQKISALKGSTIHHLSTRPYKDAGETPVDFLRSILAEIKTGGSLFS
jgi:DNA primase